jgi:acetyl-CoA acetyltransferase
MPLDGLRNIASVVGVGQTDWRGDWTRSRSGEKPDDSVGYAATAFRDALGDAGLHRDDIDGLIVGPTTAYERMGEVLGLEPRWGMQADAVNAVVQACMAIRAGLAEVVALVYGNDQRTAGTQYGGPQASGGANYLSYVYHAPWGLTSQGALYALMLRAWAEARGTTAEQLGQVAVAQRRWARLNPHAIMQSPMSTEDYLAAPFICEPLRLPDYCMINDGGVALIIAEAGRAARISACPVQIAAVARQDINRGATSLEPRITDFYLPAQQTSAARLWDTAGIGPEDVGIVQIYDSFSVHVPLALEGYGYCPVGEVGRFLLEDGIGPGGRVAVNSSGGHLSESYMQGWNHQLECVRQLRGTCGSRQVSDNRFAHYSSDVAGKATSILYARDTA